MDMACFFHLTMSALQGNEHSKLLALEREVALDQGLAKGRVLEVAVEVALDSAVEVAVATVLYGRARGYPLTLVGSYCPGWSERPADWQECFDPCPHDGDCSAAWLNRAHLP